jgi:formate hydrogenlyase transcriptional activator
VLEYTGLTKEEVESERFREAFHPEDSERLRAERDAAISRGVPFEYEQRVRRKNGQFRWFLIQYNPLLDERGKVIRWYATGTDIDDRKRAEERTRQENVALREQIDEVFMFDEIVGSSPALKGVLSGIVKVAPTGSTVLITGDRHREGTDCARHTQEFATFRPGFYCGELRLHTAVAHRLRIVWP